MRKTAILAGLLLFAPLSGPALAALVPTQGDPFPQGSFSNVTGSVSTPYALVENISISNFGAPMVSTPGGSQTFSYGMAELSARLVDPTTHATLNLSLLSSGFTVTVSGRTAPDDNGTFSLSLAPADFTGSVNGHMVDVTLMGAGVATFVNLPYPGLVSTQLTLSPTYSVDGGPFSQLADVVAVSSATPPAAPGPVPGAGLAGLAALASAGLLARTRRA